MAHQLTKRRLSAHFMWRKNRILKRFREHVNFRRGNSIPGLTTAVAVHPRIHRSKQSEILNVLIQHNRPRDLPQSDKKVPSRAYAENRPFLDQGKSQKSLNRQNAPLTIDQVRELLNKNK